MRSAFALAFTATVIASGARAQTPSVETPKLMPAAAASPTSPTSPTTTALPAPVAPTCGTTGPLDVPPGASVERIQLLDAGKHYKVYTEVETVDDEVFQLGAMKIDNMKRLFSDQVIRTKRFLVFDSVATGVLDRSDIQVTARIVSASQVFKPLMEGDRRYSQSKVNLSVQVRNMLTGQQMLVSDALVEGETGRTSGDRVVLTSADDPTSPEVRARLAEDFKNALRRAFDNATQRLENLLPPMGRVMSVQACKVDLFGGRRGGLQPQDELIVLRSDKVQHGEVTVLTNTRTVALLRCGGVGDDVSQCIIKQSVPGYAPSEGDHAVITPESLLRTREQ